MKWRLTEEYRQHAQKSYVTKHTKKAREQKNGERPLSQFDDERRDHFFKDFLQRSHGTLF